MNANTHPDDENPADGRSASNGGLGCHIGYLYLLEGGYNHDEEWKFSKDPLLVGGPHNLTICQAIYTGPGTAEQLELQKRYGMA
jgi:hypothetical protein